MSRLVFVTDLSYKMTGTVLDSYDITVKFTFFGRLYGGKIYSDKSELIETIKKVTDWKEDDLRIWKEEFRMYHEATRCLIANFVCIHCIIDTLKRAFGADELGFHYDLTREYPPCEKNKEKI